jgi:type II secretory pathway component GspD/PulD (secretin)
MRETSLRLLVTRAPTTLGVVITVVGALDAHSAPTQSAAAVATDAAYTSGWSRCSALEDQPRDAQTPPPDAGRARIVVRDGTISLDVRACTLTQLVYLISAQTDIRITVSDALPAQTVTLRTNPEPIEAAIRQLLRHTDIFVLYAAEGAGQRLAAVWVYPRGTTHDIVPVSADVWASTRELERQLTEWDPELRARAIEELIARTGEAALPRVFEALADGDAHIRERALDAALAANLDMPLQQLQALAINDLSPEVRLRALQALEERPDTAWIIEAATVDPDSNVRREAQNILRRLMQTPQ